MECDELNSGGEKGEYKVHVHIIHSVCVGGEGGVHVLVCALCFVFPILLSV